MTIQQKLQAISEHQTPLEMLESMGEVPPRGWQRMSHIEQLDHVSTRLLAASRTTTKHKEMKEEGILSSSQMERRRRREVYSTLGDLDVRPVTRGVFSRAYRKKK